MDELFGTIAGLLKTLPEQHEFRRAMVFAAWRRVGGDGVTENAIPVDYDNGRLMVATSSETWRKQLESLSKQFAYKLNQNLGSNTVRSINCVVDESIFLNLDRGRTAISTALPINESAVDFPEISDRAAAIADTELRRKFLAAATASLAYKKRNGR
ncbi:hypothetical protein BH24ACI3_BH24ACI3_00660 [soil metagenome]